MRFLEQSLFLALEFLYFFWLSFSGLFKARLNDQFVVLFCANLKNSGKALEIKSKPTINPNGMIGGFLF